ncbi:MAG TPA: PBP1A family penicillin-binding protein [Gemmatimonadaceae bacterium]|nr:PBP1A family penicillin-binding protein [Gemmatimonadaceae bacterium]
MRWTYVTVTFVAAFVAGFGYAAWALVCRAGQCPAVQELESYQPRQTSKLFAADGRFIAELGLERRTLIKISEIPPVVRRAFVTIEDKRFYDHNGIDWYRVPGAVWAVVRTRSFSQGFSTITMQLAGNIFPERINRRERSGLGGLTRKLKEIKVARAIEQRYPKDRILELYLNQIYLGNGANGVETAAQRYFGKSAKDLNLVEAATLAALPRAPERYNPRKYPDRAVQRRNTIIEVMRREGEISDADASLGKAYPLRLATRTESGDVAPYFVEWVRQLLDQQFGQQLYEQGLKVYTTLDLDLQSAAERAMERQLRAIEAGKYGTFRHTTYEQYIAQSSGDAERDSPNSPYLQGAFVAMDPRTGAVRALVGGRDFDDSKFNRAVQALRQPGSTFKPVVYAAAIQNGRPPTYILDDSPLTVPMAQGDTWSPQNYDGQYEGQIPLRKALYESRNVPTIRLGMELGEQTVIDMGRKLGLSTPIPAYPSIHIGAADVYPIEMIAAYSAFATLGMQARAMGIVRVENANGETIWSPEPIRVPVLSPEEAWLMVDMMKDVVRRGTAAASVGSQFSIPSGGKTGTTNDYTDVWYLGYTSDLVAGVWMGFDKPERIMTNAQGGRLAAPAWTAFMTEVYRRKPAPPDWPRPAGIVTKTVDLLTNSEWVPGCPGVEATEFFIAGTEPMTPCNLMPGLPTDTTAFTTLPPGSYPPTSSPRDTALSGMPANPLGGRVVPGAAPMPRPATPRDTGVLPRPSSTIPPPVPGARVQPAPGAGRVVVPPVNTRPDTSHIRIDSVKRGVPVRDTIRRVDSARIEQQGRRPARPH